MADASKALQGLCVSLFGSVSGALQHLSDIAEAQFLPQSESHDLTIPRAKPVKGIDHLAILGPADHHGLRKWNRFRPPHSGEARSEAMKTTVRASSISQHVACHAEEPQPGFGFSGHVVEAVPNGQEDVGGGLDRVVTIQTTKEVSEDIRLMPLVQGSELRLSLHGVSSRPDT
ncbi:MAG: hypothetical protein U9R51_07685 [Actinomycetota bacterium]|nr:hypothetical protein [Actinomycetota bacterium]